MWINNSTFNIYTFCESMQNIKVSSVITKKWSAIVKKFCLDYYIVSLITFVFVIINLEILFIWYALENSNILKWILTILRSMIKYLYTRRHKNIWTCSLTFLLQRKKHARFAVTCMMLDIFVTRESLYDVASSRDCVER